MTRPDVTLIVGDCVEAMAAMDPESVDAVVCDPPYGLEFMGKGWDKLGIDEPKGDTRQPGDDTFQTADNAYGAAGVRYGSGASYGSDPSAVGAAMQAWHRAWATEALRVLRPGGHLLAFGGTRTYHRLASGLEDAGFEVRDCLAWMYGSGFPKSLDVGKAIDKAAGAEREVVGQRTDGRYAHGFSAQAKRALGGVVASESDTGFSGAMGAITEPATAEAAKWDGWGTALKPAFEPIVLARKPLVGTVAANVLAHGTGALNVDGCRVAFLSDEDEDEAKSKNAHADFGTDPGGNAVYGDYSMVPRVNYDPPGRWPANVILDADAGGMLDDQSGDRAPGNHPATRTGRVDEKTYGSGWSSGTEGERIPTDAGGASRFFYCAKTGASERHAGVEGDDRNKHPTVKPIDLMRWLIRLVIPRGGVVLDPFLGSGTTGCAAALEGAAFIGVEREPEYMAIAEARIRFWEEHGEDGVRICAELDAAGRVRQAVADAGQLDLFAEPT